MAAKKIEPTKKASEEPAKDPDTAPPISDVAKPGETAAPPTSKPVIVGHGPTVKQDPMVNADTEKNASDASGEEDNKKPLTKKSELKLEPSEEIKAEVSESEKEGNPPAGGEQNADKSTEEKPEEKNDEPAEQTSSESGEIDALAEEAEAKNKEKKALSDQQKIDEQTQKVIDSKQYFLPIVEGGKKRSAERVVSWIFLILLVTAVAAWVAIDAGYLNVGLELPYDFIKN